MVTSAVLAPSECTKIVFGRGSAPDVAGGAHDAPPDPLVDWGGGYLLTIPHPFGASILRPYRHFFLSTSSPDDRYYLNPYFDILNV